MTNVYMLLASFVVSPDWVYLSVQWAAIIRSTTGRAAAARRPRWIRRLREERNWSIRRCWTLIIPNRTPIRLENRSKALWVHDVSPMSACALELFLVCLVALRPRFLICAPRSVLFTYLIYSWLYINEKQLFLKKKKKNIFRVRFLCNVFKLENSDCFGRSTNIELSFEHTSYFLKF